MKKGAHEPCQREKRLLDTFIHLDRSLHEQVDTQLIGDLTRLFLCNLPLVCSVRFIADEDLADAFRDILLDMRVPCADISAWLLDSEGPVPVVRISLTIERKPFRNVV